MSSDLAIKIAGVSKRFQIYETPRDRLKQFVLPRVRGMLGLRPMVYCREFWALRDLSFEVKKGETVGIVGRNGSGKSTLLQIICGTIAPTLGTIETRGRVAALLELGSGFNPEFSGRENVYLNGAVLGLSQTEIEARFDDIAAFADIGQFLERPVKTYSSGMYVRLAFAVQAMVDPDIFIVDEALAVGDEKFQRKCFARLEKLKAEGSSILFVSHSSASVIELCDRTLLLDRGVRVMYSNAQDTVRAYQKLIYAPDELRQSLVEELVTADLSTSLNGAEFVSNPTSNNSITPNHNEKQLPSREPIEGFDQGLVPETTTVYPVQGVEIQSISIRNKDGVECNLLHPNKDYYFIVSGLFRKDFVGIFWGIHIKSTSGVVITGQRIPEEGKFYESAKDGQKFEIKFTFRMDLLPGTYFVGGGAWSSEEPVCAHRIMDAIMFRVLPSNKPQSFGYVNLLSESPDLKISSDVCQIP